MGSTTTQDRPGTRGYAPVRIAFRFDDSVGVPIAIFRSSIPSPSMPLFTLHHAPRDAVCKTRGRVVRYSFLVRLLHPLLHAGLSRRTVNYFFRSATIISHAWNSNCRRTADILGIFRVRRVSSRIGWEIATSRSPSIARCSRRRGAPPYTNSSRGSDRTTVRSAVNGTLPSIPARPTC